MAAMLFAGHDVAVLKAFWEAILSKYDELGARMDEMRFEYTYDPRASRATGLMLACCYAGLPDMAVRYSEAGRQRAREIRHSMTLCLLSAFDLPMYETRRDVGALETCADECFEVATRDNLGFFGPWASLFQGFARAMRGYPEGVLQHWDDPELVRRVSILLVSAISAELAFPHARRC